MATEGRGADLRSPFEMKASSGSRPGTAPGAHPDDSGGRLRNFLSSWRPSSRRLRKLSLKTGSRLEPERSKRDEFFSLGDIGNGQGIRTAVVYGSSAETFAKDFSDSRSGRGQQSHPDFYQLTTSPLKYVKKSRDSLQSSSDDDSSGDESHHSPSRAEPRGEFTRHFLDFKKADQPDTEEAFIARARERSSKASRKDERAEEMNALPRRPHSAPAYPNSLTYAIEALRSHTNVPQSLTVPSSRSTSAATRGATSSKSNRNSVGHDSAIGLDDGRMSSPSSSPNSSSSTPACQPNNSARRSSGMNSGLSSSLTPATSTSSCGSTTTHSAGIWLRVHFEASTGKSFESIRVHIAGKCMNTLERQKNSWMHNVTFYYPRLWTVKSRGANAK